MASTDKVTNPVTQMMRFITCTGATRAECLREKCTSCLEVSWDQRVTVATISAGISDLFGTDFAQKHFALKEPITILERREQ